MKPTTVSTTTLGTAAGSGGAAYALVTLLSFAFSFTGATVPDNVTNALLVLITIGIHYIVSDKNAAAVVPAAVVGPDTVIVPVKAVQAKPGDPNVANVGTVTTPLQSVQASLFAQPNQIG